jgi:hypothetical protein
MKRHRPDLDRDARVAFATTSSALLRSLDGVRDGDQRARLLRLALVQFVDDICESYPDARFNRAERSCLAEILFNAAYSLDRRPAGIFARLAALWREVSGFERIQMIGVALAVPGALLALVTLAIVAAERL